MLYKITIEEVYEVDGKDYPKKNEIYSQTVENLQVSKLVSIINEQKPTYLTSSSYDGALG